MKLNENANELRKQAASRLVLESDIPKLGDLTANELSKILEIMDASPCQAVARYGFDAEGATVKIFDFATGEFILTDEIEAIDEDGERLTLEEIKQAALSSIECFTDQSAAFDFNGVTYAGFEFEKLIYDSDLRRQSV